MFVAIIILYLSHYNSYYNQNINFWLDTNSWWELIMAIEMNADGSGNISQAKTKALYLYNCYYSQTSYACMISFGSLNKPLQWADKDF